MALTDTHEAAFAQPLPTREPVPIWSVDFGLSELPPPPPPPPPAPAAAPAAGTMLRPRSTLVGARAACAASLRAIASAAVLAPSVAAAASSPLGAAEGVTLRSRDA